MDVQQSDVTQDVGDASTDIVTQPDQGTIPTQGDTDQPATDQPATDTPKASEVQSSFPDNWQELMAGEDEKIAKALSRYSSPSEVAKALKAAQTKLSERIQIKKPDENATDDELKIWRDAWGIPEKPDDYNVYEQFKNEIADNDKPIIDEFVQKMHQNHATPDMVNTAIQTYYEIQAKNDTYLEQVNQQDAEACEEDLRQEYGRNYKDNRNRALSFIENTFGKETSEVLTKAIGNDGRMLMNNPDVVRAFVNMALQENPRVTMPSGAQSVDNLMAEKSKIQAAMRTGAYDYDPTMQARYREILEYEQKTKNR